MSSFENIAIHKLLKGNVELIQDLDIGYFSGKNQKIYKLIIEYYSEHSKLPTPETLKAVINVKAPIAVKGGFTAMVDAITNVDTSIEDEVVVSSLKDSFVLRGVDNKMEELIEAQRDKDAQKVKGILASLLEDISIQNVQIGSFEEEIEKDDHFTVIPSGLGEEYDDLIGGGYSGLTVVTAKSGCVDADTEFLTPTGWKKISEYSEGDTVLQYDKGDTSFVTPEAYINKPADKFYHLRTKYGVDMMLSPEHRVLYKSDKLNNQVASMESIAKRHTANIRGFQGRFHVGYNSPVTEGIPLSDEELRVMVMVMADGHFPNHTKYCRVTIKKPEKQKRLVLLLEASGILYKEQNHVVDGFKTFVFQAPQRNKTYTGWWSASAEQCKVIAEEVVHWDGGITNGSRNFYTNDKNSADFIQHVWTVTGNTRVSLRINDRAGQTYFTGGKEYTRKAASYSVRDTSTKFTTISGSNKANTITEVYPKDARKYCFTVPSGFFIIRRNGCITVTGNSGKSILLQQCGVEAFKAGKNVLYLSLELSSKVLGNRVKSYISDIPFGTINAGKTTTEEKKLIEDSMSTVFKGKENVWRVTSSPVDTDELLNIIKIEKQLYNIDVVIIDYLALVSPGKRDKGESWATIANLVKSLHKYTMRENVVIVTASQVNEVKKSKDGMEPEITTRGSKEIEFSATQMYYMERVESEDPESTPLTLFQIKNRLAKKVHSIVAGNFGTMKVTDTGVRLN